MLASVDCAITTCEDGAFVVECEGPGSSSSRAALANQTNKEVQVAAPKSISECPTLPVGFRHCVSFLGYAVNANAQVITCCLGGIRTPRRWRLMLPAIDTHGYRFVVMCREKRRYNRKLAVIVLEAFIGQRPPEMDSCHGPAGQQDDSLSNVRWDTRSENIKDTVRSGSARVSMQQGAMNRSSKLTDDQVREMRSLYPTINGKQLAAMFGLKPSSIYDILNRRTWSHI